MFFNKGIKGSFYNLGIGIFLTQVILLNIVIKDLAPLLSFCLINQLKDIKKFEKIAANLTFSSLGVNLKLNKLTPIKTLNNIENQTKVARL